MKKFFNMRKLRYGSNSIVLTISIIGIIILVNVFLYNFHYRIDMTKNKIYSLSDQTKQVISSLDKEVKVIGFFKEESKLLPKVASLLKEYKNHTDKITYSLVDLDSNPVKAEKYGVTDYDTVVIKSGDRTINIRKNGFSKIDYRTAKPIFAGEEALTQGIIDVTTEKQNKVYFVQGHGELSGDKIHWFKKAVKQEGYKTGTLNIGKENGIPKDADLLIIASPSSDYNNTELTQLVNYTEKGGRILLFMNPTKDPNKTKVFRMFVETLGVKINNDVVVDPVRNYFQHPLTIIPEYTNHVIVNKLNKGGFSLLMPYSTSIEKSEKISKSTKFEPLLKSSDKSWGETDLESENAEQDENDRKGPLTVAAAVTRSLGNNKEMKAVVVGNASMATNEVLNDHQSNIDFVINAINFLQDKEKMISIRSKNEALAPLTIKGNQDKYLFGTFVIGIPLIIFALGVFIFIRRRNR